MCGEDGRGDGWVGWRGTRWATPEKHEPRLRETVCWNRKRSAWARCVQAVTIAINIPLLLSCMGPVCTGRRRAHIRRRFEDGTRARAAGSCTPPGSLCTRRYSCNQYTVTIVVHAAGIGVLCLHQCTPASGRRMRVTGYYPVDNPVDSGRATPPRRV